MEIIKATEEQLRCLVIGEYTLAKVTSDEMLASQLFYHVTKAYFDYPLYITFEAYDEMRSEIISQHQIEWLGDVGSVRKLQGQHTYETPIPSFRVVIQDDRELQQFLASNYRFAVEDFFFVATQRKHIIYYPVIRDKRTQSFPKLSAYTQPHFITFSNKGEGLIIGTITEKDEDEIYYKLMEG